jgi:Mrp family chromosome partitioning ATPase/capsular polysaccharide biosynthesis protein
MRPERNLASPSGTPGWMPARPEPPQSALSPYLEAVRSHVVLVAVVLAATVISALAWYDLQPSRYAAEADVLVTPLPAETTIVSLPLIYDLRDPTRTIQTAAALVNSDAAALRTAQLLGPRWTRGEVARAIDVDPRGETNILAVRATAETGELAARLANTFATATLQVRRAALRRAAQAAIPGARAQLRTNPSPEVRINLSLLQSLARGPDPTLSIAQRATPSSSSLGPPASLVLALAVLAGAMLAVGAALAVDKLTPDRIKTEDELLTIFPLPILARLPILRGRNRRRGPLDVDPGTREALRTVQVQLDLAGRETRTIMLTSPSPDDGKTTTALAFGAALADTGARVILIDTDVRAVQARSGPRPAAPPAMALPVASDRPPSLRGMLYPLEGHENLQLLDASEIGFDGLNKRSRGRLAESIRAAAQAADYVIVDTPPLGVVSDALTLVELVDDVLVVVRLRATKRMHAEITRDLLARAGVTPEGYLVIGEGAHGSYYPYPLGSDFR